VQHGIGHAGWLGIHNMYMCMYMCIYIHIHTSLTQPRPCEELLSIYRPISGILESGPCSNLMRAATTGGKRLYDIDMDL